MVIAPSSSVCSEGFGEVVVLEFGCTKSSILKMGI